MTGDRWPVVITPAEEPRGKRLDELIKRPTMWETHRFTWWPRKSKKR